MLEEANPLLLSTEKEVHAVPRATCVSFRLLHGCVARGNRMQIVGETISFAAATEIPSPRNLHKQLPQPQAAR